mmetsp:Transcript_21173/g.56467  ORF Transcript_21173/g.56467 Transcript_21173/m.56467 type:complete len:244 (+) Transcript_21173:48-779(+)
MPQFMCTRLSSLLFNLFGVPLVTGRVPVGNEFLVLIRKDVHLNRGRDHPHLQSSQQSLLLLQRFPSERCCNIVAAKPRGSHCVPRLRTQPEQVREHAPHCVVRRVGSCLGVFESQQSSTRRGCKIWNLLESAISPSQRTSAIGTGAFGEHDDRATPIFTRMDSNLSEALVPPMFLNRCGCRRAQDRLDQGHLHGFTSIRHHDERRRQSHHCEQDVRQPLVIHKHQGSVLRIECSTGSLRRGDL